MLYSAISTINNFYKMDNITENDEQWLYGDDAKTEFKDEKPHCENIILEQTVEESHITASDEEEDSEDDGITVTIDSIDVKSNTFTHFNIKTKSEKLQPSQVKKLSVEDFRQTGNINNVSLEEFKFDSEKPWRLPGADVSDFFNYDFNEDTWTAYCERQKRMTVDESRSNLIKSNVPIVENCSMPITVIGDNKRNGIPSRIDDQPRFHFLMPNMSMPPPPISNLGFLQTKLNHVDKFKPNQEIQRHTPLGPSVPQISNLKSIEADQEQLNSCKSQSQERDFDRRRERSHDKYHPNRRSQSRSSRPRSRRSQEENSNRKREEYRPVKRSRSRSNLRRERSRDKFNPNKRSRSKSNMPSSRKTHEKYSNRRREDYRPNEKSQSRSYRHRSRSHSSRDPYQGYKVTRRLG